MKNILAAAAFMTALLCGASLAQSTTPSAVDPGTPPERPQAQSSTPSQSQPQPTPGAPKIASGTVIPTQLSKSIDAKKAKPGDEVVAKVTQDLKTDSGSMIVAKDTKIVGHVTEAQARSKEQKESQVGIVFDRAVLKDGESPLPMSIQAIIASPSNNHGDAGGYDQAGPTGSSTAPVPMSGGRGSTSGAAQSQPTRGMPSGGADAPTAPKELPTITRDTQGVVGISDLKLQTTAQGSLVSSEKNNVKIESGTFMLLRVN
jgi:hypothetical protein